MAAQVRSPHKGDCQPAKRAAAAGPSRPSCTEEYCCHTFISFSQMWIILQPLHFPQLSSKTPCSKHAFICYLLQPPLQ